MWYVEMPVRHEGRYIDRSADLGGKVRETGNTLGRHSYDDSGVASHEDGPNGMFSGI